MKQSIYSIVFFVFIQLYVKTYCQAQSLTPNVIASAGAYISNSTGSLSFTIGETITQTLSSTTHKLTQGFQQPFEINLLNVKAYLQGYYVGSGQMADVLLNQGVHTNPSLDADTLQVQLREPNAPYNLVFQKNVILKQDGSLSVASTGIIGQSYYLVIKHRNHIASWSTHPILINTLTQYDFSIAANRVYGDNQHEVESGIFAFYTGDINQDGIIDGLDYNEWENDSNNFAGGYFSTDLNGDGIVDGLDFIYWEQNNNNFIGAVWP